MSERVGEYCAVGPIFSSPSIPFAKAAILAAVPTGRPGVYAIGPTESGKLIPWRIGRSNSNLRKRLLGYVARPGSTLPRLDPDDIPRLRIAVAITDDDFGAYAAECRLWHRYCPRFNDEHPDLPKLLWVTCPEPRCNRSRRLDRLSEIQKWAGLPLNLDGADEVVRRMTSRDSLEGDWKSCPVRRPTRLHDVAPRGSLGPGFRGHFSPTTP